MASKTNKLPGFMAAPDLNYCTGRFLKLANELAAMGYKHHTIARGALNAGLEESRVNADDHRPFLRLLEEMGRCGLGILDEALAKTA